MGTLSPEQKTSADFLNIVYTIAKNHNCTVTKVDVEKKQIEIDGPEEDQIKCAMALDDALGQYLC